MFGVFNVICESMLTVSNTLLMSNATVMVRSGGLFWLNPVAMVVFMLCSTVLVVESSSSTCHQTIFSHISAHCFFIIEHNKVIQRATIQVFPPYCSEPPEGNVVGS